MGSQSSEGHRQPVQAMPVATQHAAKEKGLAVATNVAGFTTGVGVATTMLPLRAARLAIGSIAACSRSRRQDESSGSAGQQNHMPTQDVELQAVELSSVRGGAEQGHHAVESSS